MGGLVGGLLELIFLPPLSKSEVGGQVGGSVGDALTHHAKAICGKFLLCSSLAILSCACTL
jgi:hypothetical protein